jgi:hypothetical protein
MKRIAVMTGFTLFLFLLSSPAACAQSETLSQTEHLQTFAKFDEVYIPALALTKQEQAKPSRAAYRRLAERWKQVQPALTEALAGDAKWAGELKSIDEIMQVSGRQIKAGQFAEAHETLEAVRDLMMEARRRQGVHYPLDSLSDFHSTMEEIVKPAMLWTPAKVSKDDLASLPELVAVADEKWSVAENTDFNLDDFQIGQAKAKQLRPLIAQVRKAIGELQAALEAQDKQAIIQAARGLKPPFAKTYMFFGDFPKPANP